jgi:glycosyltransferase involved in cell wall biosynthesis
MKICVIAFGPIAKKNGGYEVRCHYLINSLADLGHQVYVLEFPIVSTELSTLKDKQITFMRLKGNEHTQNKFLKFLSFHLNRRLTIDIIHFIRIQLYSVMEFIKFRKVIKHCKIVFIESVFFPFGFLTSRFFGKKIILDTHYVGKLQAFRYKLGIRVNFVREFLWDILERFSIRLSDFIIVVSEEEALFLKEEYGVAESKILVVPVTVELPKVKVSQQKLGEILDKWSLRNKVVIIFLGRLETTPNADAVNYIIGELAPYIWERRKDGVFLIIGRGNEQFSGSMPPNVFFTGFVEDISPFLELSDLCIAPLRMGSGIKTKILEYMSYEKLVLTTPVGVEGIKLDEASSVIVSDIASYPENLLKIINNLEKMKRKRKSGKEIIKKHYTPSIIKKKISEII